MNDDKDDADGNDGNEENVENDEEVVIYSCKGQIVMNDDKEGSHSQIYQNLRRDDDEDDDERESHFLAPFQRYSSLKVQMFFSSSC